MLTVSKAVQSYLAELGLMGRSPQTVSLQTQLLRRSLKAVGDRPLDSITRADVTGYLGGMAARGMSQSYIHSTAKVVRRFFNWAIEQGILEASPLQGLEIHPGPDKPIAPFTDDECRRLIAATDTPLKRAAILLLMDTGLRAGELCSLRLQDIDLVNGEIAVMGKGRKARRVALNEKPRQALMKHLASRAQLDGLIWPGGWDRWRLWKLVEMVAHDARVGRCHPHRFRHSWSVRMRRAGVDAIDLQQLLGHSSLKMTMRYVAYCEQEVAVKVHKRHCVLPE